MTNPNSITPVKILYFTTELNVGGAEKILSRLLAHLDNRQFAPQVVCLYGGDGPIAAEIRALNVPLFDLKMTAKWRLDAVWRFYRLLRQESPVILHNSLFHPNMLGRFLGRLAGIPVIICTEHTMASESEWRYLMNRWTIGLVDAMIAVSDNVRDFCLQHIKLPPEKVVVIRTGIEVKTPQPASQAEARRKLNLPLEAQVVGTVSRLHPDKGVEFLVRALTQVAGASLVVIGDGPEWNRLQQLTADLNLTGRIIWAGYRPDVVDLLPAFDIFAQPSQIEGLPNTIIEAMSVALPVVATAVGGVPEIVTDGQTGLLVPACNPPLLAAALNRLLSNPELRRQMGQAGFEFVKQNFSVRQMVQQTQNLYRQLLKNKGLN